MLQKVISSNFNIRCDYPGDNDCRFGVRNDNDYHGEDDDNHTILFYSRL